LKKLTQRASRSEVIIAKTIKGKGIATLENNKLSHHCVLTREQYEETLKTLI
jgi:transketolase